MIFRILIGTGLFGCLVTMSQFTKYCRLLNRRWTLDEKTADRYQARAQCYLAATVCLIVTAAGAVLLSAFFT